MRRSVAGARARRADATMQSNDSSNTSIAGAASSQQPEDDADEDDENDDDNDDRDCDHLDDNFVRNGFVSARAQW